MTIKEARAPVPNSFLERCPEVLPKLVIDKETWDGLEGQQQINLMINLVTVQWGPEFFKCSLRHNAFVDWNSDQVTMALEDDG